MYCQTIKDYAMKPLHKSLIDSLEIISHLKDDPKYKDVVDRLWELTFEM